MKTDKKYTVEDLSKLSKEELIQKTIQLQTEIEEAQAKVDWYYQQYLLSKQARFGQSSEQAIYGQLELPLFNEAEAFREMVSIEPSPEEILDKAGKKKKSHGKKKNLDGLETVSHVYLLPPEEMYCPECGSPLHEIRPEVTVQLEVVPAKVIVHKHESMIYGCRRCEKDENVKTKMIIAPGAPKPLIKRSPVTPSFAADFITKKYVDALPFYRQEQDYKRRNIPITRNNLCNWSIRLTNDWFQLIFDRMDEILIAKKAIHCDETEVEVLAEPHRPATCNSYVWVTTTMEREKQTPIALYHYTETRASYQARQILKGFQGYIHCDGYAGYDALQKTGAKGEPAMDVTLVACMVHVKRKFKEALKVVKPSDTRYTSAAHGVEMIEKIFHIDNQFNGLSDEERYEKRLELLKPALDEFFAWVNSEMSLVLPKCKYGQAINYASKQEQKVRNVLLDGCLELDNNLAERTVKPFVIGRKNWLFSNTPGGAAASCVQYSIVQTAIMNGLIPFEYLKYLLEEMPKIENLCDYEQLDQLLPWSETIPDYVKAPSKA
jgi:transposase